MKVEQHIIEEISDMAPTLIKIGRKNPYRVPEGYWSALEQNVLGDQPKNEVPDHYFEGLADHVLAKVRAPEAKVIKFNYRALIGIASVMLLGLFAYMTWPTDQSDIQSIAAVESAEEEFDFLIDEDQLQLTDVLDLLDDEVFEDLEIGNTDDVEIDFLDDELYDYTEEELEDLL